MAHQLAPRSDLQTDPRRRVPNPDSKNTHVPVAFFAAGELVRGLAKRLDEGAVLFTPARRMALAVGSRVTSNPSLPSPAERTWGASTPHEALIVAERFSVAGEDRYLLLPPEACESRSRSPRPGHNRRRGFRFDLGVPVEAAFRLGYRQPLCKGMVGNLSFGGAALTVPLAIEERGTRTLDLDVSFTLSPGQPQVCIRTTIKNRRLVGDQVVWGLSFRLDKSSEPIRAEAAIRDYLILEQIGAIRKRGLQQSSKSKRPVFHIPTRLAYWEESRAADVSPSIGAGAWTILEAKRVRALASRLFPAVDFEISEDVPRSQTYERGSCNLEIKAVLENRTALRLTSRRLPESRRNAADRLGLPGVNRLR